MTRLTFARARPAPPCVSDWEALARFAQGLLAQREADYPIRVEDGRMPQAEADRGLRVMRAIAAQWSDACTGTPLPDPLDYAQAYGSSWDEMRTELEAVAARAARRQQAAPTHAAAIEQATLAGALLWHQQPVADGAAFPHIWKAAEHAHWSRQPKQQARAA